MSTHPAPPSGTFSVTVTRPGPLGTVYVGPFKDEWHARGFANTLNRSVRGTGVPAGTTMGIAPYDSRLPHRCVPADAALELAEQMNRESDYADFPDLFARLVADRGWEAAARAWVAARACRTPAADPTAVPPLPPQEIGMDADSIPADITKLTYTAPGPKLSQNDAAALLAHYWPAIEQHIRTQVAAGIAASPRPSRRR